MLGDNLRLLRATFNLSQRQIERDLAGRITAPYLSGLERGLRPTRPEDIDILAQRFGVTSDVLRTVDLRGRVLKAAGLQP